MAPTRFGASKFRNAVPHMPPRDEWYRQALPAAASTSITSSSASTFSSEVKSSRVWVVTLSPAGELSYRGNDAAGEIGHVSKVKGLGGGGGVGDWDLSRLEGGLLAVGGLDGSISVYNLPPLSSEMAQPTALHTILSSSSPITNLLLHPTTPSLLLASTAKLPVALYDVSASRVAPVIELNTNEAKGMWSVAWSADGKLLVGVGKSGIGSIWDPRAGKEAVMSKVLPLQPSRPARIVFVAGDLFLTSFSRSRNREYSLLSTQLALATSFTQSVDSSPGLLIPAVDEERRIIYAAGRGDMTLRQIELSGSAGFQETLHPLPHALASASLALAHPASLPVMSAQIATLLLPVIDKDGDALIPFGIRVPRRQLVDYHEDLYPEILGTVPEQSPKQWLAGENAKPLPISLDPARRSMWESAFEKKDVSMNALTPPSMATEHTSMSASEPSQTAAESDFAPDSAESVDTQKVATAALTPIESMAPLVTKVPVETSSSAKFSEDLPPLEGEETYASTSYKSRIIGLHIEDQLERHRNEGILGPLMVALQGPQGCGKTTLCEALVQFIQREPRNLRAAILSLDDLYMTNAGLKELSGRHPDNHLLSGRGLPGTHDTELAVNILSAVQVLEAENTEAVELPIFDKSLCGGEGERKLETVRIHSPIDVFILEGDLKMRYDEAANSDVHHYFIVHSLDSLRTLNEYQSDFGNKVYSAFSTIVQIEPTRYQDIFTWRLEQEHAMKAKNGGMGMTDEQVRRFVERYMPGYELWKEGIWRDNMPWAGRGLRLFFGSAREVIRMIKPTSSSPSSNQQLAPTDGRQLPTSFGAPVPVPPAISKTVTPSTPVKVVNLPKFMPSRPSNPNWSRKSLSARSPLDPTYDHVPSIATLHQDSLILKSTPQVAYFPIQGPGGRLGVHPLNKKGRIAVGGEGYLSGGVEMTDYAVEVFRKEGGGRVAMAGEDGAIRVWQVDVDGVQGAGPEPQLMLESKGIDKIVQLEFHPTAGDLLTAATNDHGKAFIRFWDLSSGEEARASELTVSGISMIAWAPSGDRMAIATKDGQILVLDPRKPSSVISGSAHDSPRSFQIAWIDSTHLVSIGFSRGSQRKINLYCLSSSQITTVHSVLIDVSPSVLFPVYDRDTSILYVWGKGERQIPAFEIHPENTAEPIAKLPSYTAGLPQLGVAFLPKRVVDVRKVEVTRALRLTAKTIEEVTFSIPRSKPEFFQDDIYGVGTIDVETPLMTAAEWLDGKIVDMNRISLQPVDMMLLSQAPQAASAAKAKFIPATEIMSQEEKKKREMDRLFQRAKADESSDEEVERKGIEPPDDW